MNAPTVRPMGSPRLAGGVGAWDWDLTSDRLTADARFAALYGLDEEAAARGLPGSAFFAPILAEDCLRVRIAVAAIRQGAEVFARDFRLTGPDGAVRWVSARGRALLDGDEQPTRFTGVLSEITDQKKIEEELRIAQTAGGVGTFEYMSGFGTAQVSEQFCRLLGLHPAEALPIRTINAVVREGDHAIIGGAEDHEPGQSFREFRIRRADTGEARWLARRGEYQADAEGKGFRFVGVLYDVTEAKHNEEKLRELAETLEQRVQARTQERDRVWSLSRDLIGVWGPDGRLQAVNPAWTALLGQEETSLVGSGFEGLLHPDDLEAMAAAIAGMGPQSVRNFDCRLRTLDGGWRWINWTMMSDGDTGYGIGRDVTERKQLEDQLRQSQKMEAVGQLTGGLAHDFNNMLTGIMGGLDVTRRRIAEGRTGDIDRFLEAAMVSAERAAALTHRLLAFSRRQSLDARSIDVSELINSMSDLLDRTFGERVELDVELDRDLWQAEGDANQLENAILNLAINARDAMPEGGRLCIRAVNVQVQPGSSEAVEQRPGDYVEIRVTDTGVGMAPSVIAKAFDPFFTTKPIGQGTGLGLSMIYGFAQQSGGHVGIASRVGHGTTVCLRLPRASGAAAIETPRPRLTPAPRGAGETVLVVEDDAAVRQLVVEVLSDLGYEALQAGTGDEALPVLRSDARLDLMITDVGLPGMNGRQLADIARQHRPALQILFMTGYAPDAAARPEFLAPGMEMVTKPFTMEALAVRIRAMIQAGHGDNPDT